MIKKICLVNLGCPKNLVDSEKILASFGEKGYALTDNPEAADFLVVNTCAFIRPAVKESLRVIEEFKAVKRKTGARLTVFGCLSKRSGDEIFRDRDIDAVAGPAEMENLPEICRSLGTGKRFFSVSGYGFPAKKLPRLLLTRPYAYLKITEGCANRCSYCTIPGIRGPLKSFPEKELLKEAEELAGAGIKELILIGQDTTSYGLDADGKPGLAGLVRKLAEFDFRWIRIMYAHPGKINAEFLGMFSEIPKLCPYVDLPLQHAAPEILRKMGRPVLNYGRLIESLRKNVPGLALRTAFIVGFPGEAEKHFLSLVDFVKEIRFERMGIFPYYPETGTRACGFPGAVPGKEKRERLKYLSGVQREILREKQKNLIGKKLEVIVERRKNGLLYGRTKSDAPEIDCGISFTGDAETGDFPAVHITGCSLYRLRGKQNHGYEKTGLSSGKL